ncbi:SRPBCC family protein [Williamsia sterculiae]|uniref:Uncharacterized conserved protein YndB, AHSA1/START domain n=1 Tax=Williamsia sterculiae TaxID=1344003 RepID=A0A1N7EZQ6_9NOCA|nr:SRPBCC family protein [Williamsia sterculiae]SIR93578.1 Uncharacterized conserved protein YndB, AHSA1/START domain [Williamsia sterculiae]
MATPLIEDSIDIAADPEAVWSVVSDLKRMSEWSPQCVRQIVLGGDVRLGTRTINVNRRGPMFWPTTAKVVAFEPARQIAFRVTENHTVWSFAITPTDTGVTLTEKREAKDGKTTAVSRIGIDKLLGGEETFESELREGIRETLGKIKRASEQA